ncbi:hypothetical protein HC823_01995 [Candidatus Gracilibacteria bacterium]|nr:hypothetical protein [Candidatus Gracilibacteria bacterium]
MPVPEPSSNFIYRFGYFIRDIISAIWNAIITIFKGLWQIVVKILDFVAQLFGIVAKFLRSILFGVAAIIVAIGVLIFAIGGTFYLVGKAIGLDESKNLETTRELILNVPAKWMEADTEEQTGEVPREEPVKISMPETEADFPEICETDNDCPLPMNYAIRSDCPYEAQCVDQKCEVVCPDFGVSTDTDLE